MKKYTLSALVSLFSALFLAGCGGGGGGGPTTQAVTTVYLFGQMSSASNSQIASLSTSIFIDPSSVLANYSAPVGATSGSYQVRPVGFAVSSKIVKLSDSSRADYDVAKNELTISLIGDLSPGNTLPFRAYTSARGGATVKGAEVAKIFFRLKTPGTTPTLPDRDLSPTVGQYRVPPAFKTGIDSLSGCRVYFDTKFQ